MLGKLKGFVDIEHCCCSWEYYHKSEFWCCGSNIQ